LGFIFSYGITITEKIYQLYFLLIHSHMYDVIYYMMYQLQKGFFMKKIIFNINYTNDEVNIIQDTLKKKSTLQTKFTQIEIAEMMGAKQPQVSNWLNGKRIPTASNLMRLSDILDEYPEDLLDKLEKIKQENNF